MGDQITPKNHAEYGEMISIIERAQENAFRAVNRELISMYWDIGTYVNNKVRNDGWGKSVVMDFAKFIQAERPDIKGFSASNIWRMRQFYETYKENEKLAPMVREISWTQNLLIIPFDFLQNNKALNDFQPLRELVVDHELTLRRARLR